MVFGHKYNTAKNLICVNFSTKIWSEYQYSNFNVTLNLKKLIITAPLQFRCNKKTFDNVKRNFFKKIPYGNIVKKKIISLPVYVPCVKKNRPYVKQYSKKQNKLCNKRRSK